MPIEIEKKYRLTKQQRRSIEKKLRELGVVPCAVEFEENTIYRGGRLDLGGCALRLRRVNDRATLTFKRRFPSASAIKHQQEDETMVADADAAHAIISGLGYQVGLIYEKRRVLWEIGKASLVIDELPFGLFMEIEASEREIKRVEKLLAAEKLTPVMETYPRLTMTLGKQRKGIFEARFNSKARRV
jgi:adenylate cyclase class 2